MSTVKATHFEHPSASTPGITLGSDGSVVLPAGFTGGIGTNVVSASTTVSFTTASTSYVDWTGMTVTITPTSATSKVLVIVEAPDCRNSGSANVNRLRIDRDGTTLLTNSAIWAPTANGGTSASITVVDSPATTSPVVYKAEVNVNAGTGNWVWGTITAIEVAA